jgi:hypothetical protein
VRFLIDAGIAIQRSESELSSGNALQVGQLGLRLNHIEAQVLWKAWPHSSVMTDSPLRSERQMAHWPLGLLSRSVVGGPFVTKGRITFIGF